MLRSRSAGLTTLPTDFDIFSPRLNRNGHARQSDEELRQTRRHQERRPVDRMEARNVLADHVNVGGPEIRAPALVGKAGRGQVIGQRVDPDIHHMPGVAGDRDTPVERRPADRKIVEPALDESHDLVAIFLRRHEIWVGLVILEQPVAIGREPEEIAFLLDPARRRARRRQLGPLGAGRQFALLEIGFVAHRIPTRIFAEVDVAVGGHALPDRLTGATVARLRRPHDVVGARVERLPHVGEFAAIPSTNACGVMSARAAVCCTLRPCSSMPVTNNTSRPSSRMKRWIASVAMRS